jgi:hypothetical protein
MNPRELDPKLLLPNATPEEIAALPEPQALALLEAALQQRSAGLIQALADSSNKALAKAAKKALYQLKSLGVAVPERTPATAAVRPPAASEEHAELPNMLSAVTGSGERALVVARPLRSGLEVSQLIFTDEHGILHYTRIEMGRSAYRKNLRELQGPSAPPVLEIFQEQARAILGQAWGRNRATDTALPNGADDFLRKYEVTPIAQLAPVPPPQPGDERLVLSGHHLHQQPEIQSWLPPEEQLRLLSAKADTVSHSLLEMSPTQKSVQMEHQFRQAAHAFFSSAELRELYARRLWAMGEFFEKTARPEPAAIARAEARRLFHHALEPFSRFAEYLFEKVLVLTAHLRQPPGGGPATPGEVPEPAAEPPERKSPGGLILP